jgi:hypothetical protein
MVFQEGMNNIFIILKLHKTGICYTKILLYWAMHMHLINEHKSFKMKHES